MNISNFNYLNLNKFSFEGIKIDNKQIIKGDAPSSADNPIKIHGYAKFLKNHRVDGPQLCRLMQEALKIIEFATCSKTDFFCDSFIEKHGIEFNFS